MRKKLSALLLVMLALGAVVVACGNDKIREEEYVHNVIRIYDVEPQIPQVSKEEGQEPQVFEQHYLRVGMLEDISDRFNDEAPFVNQIKEIAEESGAEIEYLVFDNWEELLQAEEEFYDVKVTEMILFNNSYEGSLIKEMASGRYLDLKPAMDELGFYEEESYEQMVLSAGMLDGQQVFVPVLYNVSGMIEPDPEWWDYVTWQNMMYEHTENSKPDYEESINMLMEAMRSVNVEEKEVPFLSPSFLNGELDLYLTASGIEWDSYGQHRELFGFLYDYVQTYQRTQVETQNNGISNQALYGEYIKDYRYSLHGEPGRAPALSLKAIDELNIDYVPVYDGVEEPLYTLVVSMLDRTEYFVDCTTAEDVAFHSVMGLLGYRDYYVKSNDNGLSGEDLVVGKVRGQKYWPIWVYGSGAEYAAQPICYAAVVDGGSSKLAAKVLQAMMNQPMDAKYGIPVCKEIQKHQMETWTGKSDRMGHVRTIGPDLREKTEQAYWGVLMGLQHGYFFEDKEICGLQIQNQIDHIVAAEIPDREILAIWQDTLTESVELGLSAQAGFELLCERMDAWYKD